MKTTLYYRQLLRGKPEALTLTFLTNCVSQSGKTKQHSLVHCRRLRLLADTVAVILKALENLPKTLIAEIT